MGSIEVDDTINLPGSPRPGPIDPRDIAYLKQQGHIVGIIGNYYVGLKYWQDVWKTINFWGPMGSHNKAAFMGTIKLDIGRTQPLVRDFVMVGNKREDAMKGLVLPSSQDDAWARVAGWRFLSESEFAKGRR